MEIERKWCVYSVPTEMVKLGLYRSSSGLTVENVYFLRFGKLIKRQDFNSLDSPLAILYMNMYSI